MNFPERLNALFKATDMKKNDLPEKIGISRSMLFSYLAGRNEPTAAFFQAIKTAFPQFNIEWLITGIGDMESPTIGEPRGGRIKGIHTIQDEQGIYDQERYSEVGVYALAGAGPARDLVEHEPIEMIVIPKSFWKPSIVAIKVRGRSMEPLILDGAYLGIDRDERWIISGEIYAVWIPYEGAVIKRLYIDPERITLRSDNKDFPEFSILVKEASAEMILGRVKWVLQQF